MRVFLRPEDTIYTQRVKMKKPTNAGRPSSFRPEYIDTVKKLCLLGATDKQMADIFGVAESTFNKWKIDHPEFSESLKEGKEIADAQVASSLFNRALGYSHNEDDIRAVNGEIVITPTIKHYPPDTTACIFWLKNRQPKLWREKQPELGEGEEEQISSVSVSVKDASRSD